MNIEIANRALIKIGEAPISSNNQKPLGEILQIVYDEVKLNLLSSYPWRFAIKRVVLAPLDEGSDNPRFKYKFQLPSDYLLLKCISDINHGANLRDYNATTGTRYEVEGNCVYYTEDNLPVIYVADVDEKLYPPLFKEALANKLASELSIKVHQNLSLVELYEQKFNVSIENAISHNEIIADTEEMPDNSWIAIRGGWNIGY